MATRRPTTRGVLAYSLHGRMGSEVVDYPTFFRRLSRVTATDRQTSVGINLVAISSMVSAGDSWLLRVVAGDEATAPVFFNPVTGEEVEAAMNGQILANGVWVLVNPFTRHVAVEQKRPGVPVTVIAGVLGHLSKELGLTQSRATFSLNPIASESFLEDVERYERIRQATICVAEPNYSWADNATSLTDYAAASDGATAEMTITAPRKGSLSKTSGIVADIKTLAARRIGPLKNVKIRGRRDGEKKETGTSLERHQERTSYEVSAADSLADERQAFAAAADALLTAIPVDELDTDD
jgi:hypothetical protein